MNGARWLCWMTMNCPKTEDEKPMKSNSVFFKDKDKRRNMKHEHYGYLFRCEHCGFEDDILVGAGMMFPIIYEEIVEKIFNKYLTKENAGDILNT